MSRRKVGGRGSPQLTCPWPWSGSTLSSARYFSPCSSPTPPHLGKKGGPRLTRFWLVSLDESFTLTPQARSGLGKISDQPPCVQFRNMEPVGAKCATCEWQGPWTDGWVSWVPSAMPQGQPGVSFCHFVPSCLSLKHIVSSQLAQ